MKKIIIKLISIILLCFLSFNSLAGIHFIKSHRWEKRIINTIGISAIIAGGIYLYNRHFNKNINFKKNYRSVLPTPNTKSLFDPDLSTLYGDSDSETDTSSIEASPSLDNLIVSHNLYKLSKTPYNKLLKNCKRQRSSSLSK